MSYAIGTIIYGVPIPSKGGIVSSIREALGEDALEKESAGFFSCYEGTNPAWFGVRLGEIDETEDVDLETLPQPTLETRKKYSALIDQLPTKLKTHFTNPRWMIVWSSS